jgi:hypothetical protein
MSEQMSEEVAQAVTHYVTNDINYFKNNIDESRWATEKTDEMESTDDYRWRCDAASVYYDNVNKLKYKWGIDYK